MEGRFTKPLLIALVSCTILITSQAFAQATCTPAATACGSDKKSKKLETKLISKVNKTQKKIDKFGRKKDKLQEKKEIKLERLQAKATQLALQLAQAVVDCANSGGGTVGSISVAGIIFGSRVALFSTPEVLASETPECQRVAQLEAAGVRLATQIDSTGDIFDSKIDNVQTRIDQTIVEQDFLCCQLHQFKAPVEEGGVGCLTQVAEPVECTF